MDGEFGSWGCPLMGGDDANVYAKIFSSRIVSSFSHDNDRKKTLGEQI